MSSRSRHTRFGTLSGRTTRGCVSWPITLRLIMFGRSKGRRKGWPRASSDHHYYVIIYVILSAATASRSGAVAASKDPYLLVAFVPRRGVPFRTQTHVYAETPFSIRITIVFARVLR